MDDIENRDMYFDTRDPNATINPIPLGATSINTENVSMPKTCVNSTLNGNVWKRWNPDIPAMLDYLRGITIREPPEAIIFPTTGVNAGMKYCGGYGVIFPNGGWVSFEITGDLDLIIHGGAWPTALRITGNSDGTNVKGEICDCKRISCPAPDVDKYLVGPFRETQVRTYTYSGRWGYGTVTEYSHLALVSGVRLALYYQFFDSWGNVTFSTDSQIPYGKSSTFTSKITTSTQYRSRGNGNVRTPSTSWYHYALVGRVRR